jgi:hypothetical protein
MSARTRTNHVFITQPDHHQTIDTLYGMDGWRERPSAIILKIRRYHARARIWICAELASHQKIFKNKIRDPAGSWSVVASVPSHPINLSHLHHSCSRINLSSKTCSNKSAPKRIHHGDYASLEWSGICPCFLLFGRF